MGSGRLVLFILAYACGTALGLLLMLLGLRPASPQPPTSAPAEYIPQRAVVPADGSDPRLTRSADKAPAEQDPGADLPESMGLADSDRVLRAALDAGIISLEPLDEGQWTELYAAYEASGCADLYQRHLGPIQVRPVGVSWEDFHRSSRSPAFIEGLASIRSRFARRTIDHPLRNGQFMLLNYPDGGGTCTSVGRMLPGAGLEARQLVLAIAGSRGYRAQDIPEETMARATRIADDHHVNRLRIGAVLWTAVQEYISAQGIRPSSAGGQVLFVDAKVGGGTLNGGDDPDVDEALGALRREADAIQAYLERQFQ